MEKKYKFRCDHPLDQTDARVELNKKGEVKDIGKEISVKKTHAEFLEDYLKFQKSLDQKYLLNIL